MTSAQNKVGPNLVELSVELGREDLVQYIQAAEDALGRDLKVDGFRPGKAPKEKIREKIGDATILETALQTAVQRSLSQVLAEQKLDVIEVTDLNVKENSSEKLLYSVRLHLFPEVKLPPLSSIKVDRRSLSVEASEVDQAIETIRASRASLSDTSEPAQTGDRVEVDFQVKEKGQLIEGGESKNHPVVIGKNNFVPGFEDQLEGMKKGESKAFSLNVPSDFGNKTIAGKKLEFSVTVQDIKKVSLPDVTDEFAKSLGKFENMDQLALSIREGLLEEKNIKERQRVRLEIMNALIEKSKCEVSPAMVEDQLTTMIQNFDQDLSRHGMELNLYLSKIGKTQDELKKEWRSEADRQVKMALILHALAKGNNVEVAPEEVDEALEELIQSTMVRDGGTVQNIDSGRMRAAIQSRLLNEKTFDFLEKICVKS